MANLQKKQEESNILSKFLKPTWLLALIIFLLALISYFALEYGGVIEVQVGEVQLKIEGYNHLIENKFPAPQPYHQYPIIVPSK